MKAETSLKVASTGGREHVDALKSQLEEALIKNTLLADKNKELIAQLAELATGRSFSSDDQSAAPGIEVRIPTAANTPVQSGENEEITVLRETIHHLSERIAEDEALKLALQDECRSTKNASVVLEQVLEEKSKDLWALSRRNEALVKELADLREGFISPTEQMVQLQMNLQKSLADSVEEAIAAQGSLATVSFERDRLQEENKSLNEELIAQKLVISAERTEFGKEKLAWEQNKLKSLEEVERKLRDESTLRQNLELKLANLSRVSSPRAEHSGGAGRGDNTSEKLFFPPDENSLEAPVVFLELGNFELRLGLWSRKTEQFEECFRCPAIIAEVKDRSVVTRDKLYDLVGSASKVLMEDFNDSSITSSNGSQSFMYELFRETGIFVGADAHYCLFEHPDPVLRSALQLTPILRKDKLVHAEGLGHLLNHCFSRGLGIDNHGSAGKSDIRRRGLDFQRIQLLFSYKACFDNSELSAFAQVFFEVLGLQKVCFVNEAKLMTAYLRNSNHDHAIFTSYRLAGHAAVSMDRFPVSMLIVDIGSTRTHVYPIFEGFAIRQFAKASEVGGESCSELLRELLARQMARKFSSMPIRRQLSIARRLKEKYAFIAENSFEESEKKFGTLVLERKNALRPHDDEPTSATTDHTASIRHVEPFTSPDGESFNLHVDRERFYCAEVLFRPDMLEVSAGQPGVVELIHSTIAAIDVSVRKEICSCVLLCGRSSKIPGLAERLQNELLRSEKLQKLGCVSLLSVESLESKIVAAEAESNRDTSVDSSATWLGAEIRMKASLSLSPAAFPSFDEESFMSCIFKKQEFILDSEYQENGTSVVELLLDDCY